MRDGGSFAHPECYQRNRAKILTAALDAARAETETLRHEKHSILLRAMCLLLSPDLLRDVTTRAVELRDAPAPRKEPAPTEARAKTCPPHDWGGAQLTGSTPIPCRKCGVSDFATLLSAIESEAAEGDQE
jgi:hypothetical protein